MITGHTSIFYIATLVKIIRKKKTKQKESTFTLITRKQSSENNSDAIVRENNGALSLARSVSARLRILKSFNSFIFCFCCFPFFCYPHFPHFKEASQRAVTRAFVFPSGGWWYLNELARRTCEWGRAIEHERESVLTHLFRNEWRHGEEGARKMRAKFKPCLVWRCFFFPFFFVILHA